MEKRLINLGLRTKIAKMKATWPVVASLAIWAVLILAAFVIFGHPNKKQLGGGKDENPITDNGSGLRIINSTGTPLSGGSFALTVDKSGKIMVGGEAKGVGGADFGLMRFGDDGAADLGFGTNGKLTFDFDKSGDSVTALAGGAGGKIVVGGETNSGAGGGTDFALVRLNDNGSLDTSFGTNGRVITDFANDRDNIFAITIQTDGKIVAVGSTVVFPNPSIFALARYNTNGTLDTTFGTNGKVTTAIGGTEPTSGTDARAVAIDASGKVVVAGAAGSDFALARYNSNGTLDTTFNTTGKVTTDFGGFEAANSLAIDTSGKIVLGGNTLSSANNNTSDFALARYNTNGTLDTTFGNGGKVTTDFDGDEDEVSSILIQNGGKLIVGGSATIKKNGDFALVRYNSNGTLDTSFDTGGKVTTDFNKSSDFLTSMAIGPDGKLVAVGQSGNTFALAKYEDNGALDKQFARGQK